MNNQKKKNRGMIMLCKQGTNPDLTTMNILSVRPIFKRILRGHYHQSEVMTTKWYVSLQLFNMTTKIHVVT